MPKMDSEEWYSWDEFYRQNKFEEMPWFEKELDKDVELEIKEITKGVFLDIGTGPGTQALELVKRGFSVTGSDIASSAISTAQKTSNQADFVTDDILESKFKDNSFDYILDRGCFHTFKPIQRSRYLNQVNRILKKNGILFLKCMSKEETNLPEGQGPYKFSIEDIRHYFENYFEIIKSKKTVYYGKIRPLPKSLFFVMKKIDSLP